MLRKLQLIPPPQQLHQVRLQQLIPPPLPRHHQVQQQQKHPLQQIPPTVNNNNHNLPLQYRIIPPQRLPLRIHGP